MSKRIRRKWSDERIWINEDNNTVHIETGVMKTILDKQKLER